MMTDPISDMLTRIRNAQRADKVSVRMPASQLKMAVAKVLQDEGFIAGVEKAEEAGLPVMEVQLKYHNNKPVIERIDRVSKPGRRQYRGKDDLPKVSGGIGVAIISTSKGVMTERDARKAGVGGEILCYVS
jgi:small subunit ribosomal protein S8